MLSRRHFLKQLSGVGMLLFGFPVPDIPSDISPAKPDIITREQWGALPPNHNARYERGFYDLDDNPFGWRVYDDPATTYKTAVIHHSAFFDITDDSALDVIQERHREQNGWADIGYHYMIGKTGSIYEGRPLNVRGAHVTGYNTGSLGICLLGNFMLERPTPDQLRSAEKLILWAKHHLQLTHIATHRQFESITECPGDNLQRHLETLAEATHLTIGIDGYVPPSESQLGCLCCSCDGNVL